MCGRYALETPPEDIKRLLPFANSPNFPASYNIAPSHAVPAVREAVSPAGAAQRECVLLQWGLVPGWIKAGKTADLSGRPQINARSETVAEKPFFRAAFKSRRCLLPADAFYEWQRAGDGKGKNQPFCIRREDRQPFMMAGIWEHWQGADGSEMESCAILTTAANETLTPIHHRMPVVLEAAHWTDWLSTPPQRASALTSLLKPASEESLIFYPVSEAVNRVANNSAALLETTAEAQDSQMDLF